MRASADILQVPRTLTRERVPDTIQHDAIRSCGTDSGITLPVGGNQGKSLSISNEGRRRSDPHIGGVLLHIRGLGLR
jgi:hypothetical protein